MLACTKIGRSRAVEPNVADRLEPGLRRIRAGASGVTLNPAWPVSFPLPILKAFPFSPHEGPRPRVLWFLLLHASAIVTLMMLRETTGPPFPN
jgi:hypothetical protein